MQGLGGPTLHAAENPQVTSDFLKTTDSLLLTRASPITRLTPILNVICTVYPKIIRELDKNQQGEKIYLQHLLKEVYTSGPAQLKPMLYKGQW